MHSKIAALFMSAAMILSLASCGNTGSSSAVSSSSGTVSAQSGASSAAPPEDRKEVTLTAFVQQSVNSESGIWQGWGAQRLYDDLKIKLDLYPTGNEVEQKLKQYLAAGDLPDILGFKGLDQAQYAIDAGMLLDLNSYKDQLPEIFQNSHYADAVRYCQENNSNGTNSLFIMPSAIGPVSYNAYNWVPLFQWQPYKEIGTPEINTLEDYLDVVEAMVKVKPTTADGEKVYGFSLFSDWDKYTALEVSTLSYFYGIDTEYVSHLMETNMLTKETSSVLADNSFYKRALKFYFEANQRGLLDPDSMSQTFSNVDAKFSAGRVMFSHFSWMTGNYNSPASGHVTNEEKPDGYANTLANDMKLYEAPDQTIGRNWYFAIASRTKETDRAIEFMNWLYSPATNEYLSNGPQGVIWELDAKGEPYVTEDGWKIVDNKKEPLMPESIGGGSYDDGSVPFNTLPMQASSIMPNGYTIKYNYWPTSPMHNLNAMKIDNNKMFSERLGSEVLVLADYIIPKNMVGKSTQAVNMIPPMSDELEMTVSQIGEIVKKYSWQMVYAANEQEFEDMWQQMCAQANGLGMDKVEEYYKTEWQNALSKAQKYE